MASDDTAAAAARVRRPPPDFRPVTVVGTSSVGPRLVRVTMGGPALDGFPVPEPAASVRLLLPSPGEREIVIPTWHGNEFLLPDGRRPTIRTLTPRAFNPDSLELAVEIVLHDRGAASGWAAGAEPAFPAAVSGPGRGYEIDGHAERFVLAGDETAIPAISQLLAAVPHERRIAVLIEVAAPEGRVPVPEHPGAAVEWVDATLGAPVGDALVTAVRGLDIDEGTRVWAAGEAAAMQRIRKHLFEERGLPRSIGTVRGYWKHGRTGE